LICFDSIKIAIFERLSAVAGVFPQQMHITSKSAFGGGQPEPIWAMTEREKDVMHREIKVICQCAHIKVGLMKRWAMGKMIFDMKGCRWMLCSTPCWDN